MVEIAALAKKERRMAFWSMKEAHPHPLSLLDIMGPINIKLTRTGPSPGFDGDNLQASFNRCAMGSPTG